MNLQWRRLIEGIVRRMPWPVVLKTPSENTSWDGNSYSSTGAATEMDLQALFGVPRGVRAVLMSAAVRDSAAWGTSELYWRAGPSAAKTVALVARCYGGDVWSTYQAVIPCDVNGHIWYEIVASGTNTLSVYLRVWGYWV